MSEKEKCPLCEANRARAEAAEARVKELEDRRDSLLVRLHKIIGTANGDDGPPLDEWSLDDPQEAVEALRARANELEADNCRMAEEVKP